MTTKDNGVYYTPNALSEYMVKRSFASLPKERELSILEPSCGDGVFIDAISNTLDEKQKKLHSLECVEIDPDALAIAKSKSCTKFKRARFINQDFLDFLASKRKRYDLIIGNPPYVVRKRLSEEIVEKCKAVYQDTDLSDRYFRNLWGAFLVGSIKLLSDKGVLAYVLPAELLQVKFSEELRNKLIDNFDRVEVVSFKSIIFKGIEQDTIILFCYKKHSKKGLFFDEKKDVDDLIKSPISFQKKDVRSIEGVKWTSHVLTEGELDLLLSLKKRFSPISDYCTAVAGIVTAANNYFIVDDKTVEEYGLEEFILPIIQRGLYINGSATFTAESLEYLRKKGKACHLLNFNGHDESTFSEKAKEYIDLGKKQKIHQRYKCQKRSPWYAIPGVWQSEGFFFKRSHLYPKLLSNQAGCMVTDAAYRIRMNEGFDISSLVYSFYNSLSLSLAELEGRFYGGGVLELTPNEFKAISIPYSKVSSNDFLKFSKKFDNKKCIEDIVKELDEKIFVKGMGLDSSTVAELQKIKIKLTKRRLGKMLKT